MSASLTKIDINLLYLVWGVAITFAGSAVLLCMFLSVRRFWRNKDARKSARETAIFDVYICNVLKSESSLDELIQDMPVCSVDEMSAVILHYFRTMRGKGYERLQTLILTSDLESLIIQASRRGIRGRKAQAIKVLSYLTSPESLQVIFENLHSKDKYILLTVARCLVRRGALEYLPDILQICRVTFPTNIPLLADIVAKYGDPAVHPLETIIAVTDDEIIRAACLEALILIMPAHTKINLVQLMQSTEPAVRAAALSLSTISQHPNAIDPIRIGLEDKTTKVKIRAAKLACKARRSDMVEPLHNLLNDPVIWVRYWALKAIWETGDAGQKFVSLLGETNPMAKNVACEMRSGYV